MKHIGSMTMYDFEEVKDELLGRVGTPERDEHERMVREAVEKSRSRIYAGVADTSMAELAARSVRC